MIQKTKAHNNTQKPTISAITQINTNKHKNTQINTKTNNFPQFPTKTNKNTQQNPTKSNNFPQKHKTKSNKKKQKTRLRQPFNFLSFGPVRSLFCSFIF